MFELDLIDFLEEHTWAEEECDIIFAAHAFQIAFSLSLNYLNVLL